MSAAPITSSAMAQDVQAPAGSDEVPASQSSDSTQAPQTLPQPDMEAPAGPRPQADPLAESGSALPSIDTGTLPHDLSPWGMFIAADIVVQAVIVGLVIASVVTWTVWLAKSFELWLAKHKARRALAEIDNASSLDDAAEQLGNQSGVVRAFVDAAIAELNLSNASALGALDKAGVKERILSRLDGLQIAAARQMNMGTGVLATIGATAPFVGLFGTVWGIMNSFIGISEAQTTNLAVVAPGIAEALLATALGLAAAIPAVIIYNYFSRSIGDYRALIADAAAEIMRQVSRELDASAVGRRRGLQRAAE